MESRRISRIERMCAIALLSMLSLGAFAQAGNTKEFPLNLELMSGFGTPCKKSVPMGAEFNIGYHVTSRFSVMAITETEYMVVKNGSSHDYNRYTNLGGGLGYVFLPQKDGDKDAFEIRGSFTSSVGGKEYKNNELKVGVYWYGVSNSKRIVPIVGVGYKFMDFREHGMPNYNGVYVTIGFRF